MKFKELQAVVVVGMIFNGERIDARGMVMGYAVMGPNTGKVMVKVNTVVLSFDEDRVMDSDEYFAKKRGKNEH
jgi:hypothetical protein